MTGRPPANMAQAGWPSGSGRRSALVSSGSIGIRFIIKIVVHRVRAISSSLTHRVPDVFCRINSSVERLTLHFIVLSSLRSARRQVSVVDLFKPEARVSMRARVAKPMSGHYADSALEREFSRAQFLYQRLQAFLAIILNERHVHQFRVAGLWHGRII